VRFPTGKRWIYGQRCRGPDQWNVWKEGRPYPMWIASYTDVVGEYLTKVQQQQLASGASKIGPLGQGARTSSNKSLPSDQRSDRANNSTHAPDPGPPYLCLCTCFYNGCGWPHWWCFSSLLVARKRTELHRRSRSLHRPVARFSWYPTRSRSPSVWAMKASWRAWFSNSWTVTGSLSHEVSPYP
jgi:hypothetical protein